MHAETCHILPCLTSNQHIVAVTPERVTSEMNVKDVQTGATLTSVNDVQLLRCSQLAISLIAALSEEKLNPPKKLFFFYQSVKTEVAAIFYPESPARRNSVWP